MHAQNFPGRRDALDSYVYFLGELIANRNTFMKAAPTSDDERRIRTRTCFQDLNVLLGAEEGTMDARLPMKKSIC